MPLSSPSEGYLSITLHAHLPYVLHHGTWPHGLEWLLEAASETYLPLLRMLGRLQRDNVPVRMNLSLSPVLVEQLAHPAFRTEFPAYIGRKLSAAHEDEAFFQSCGEQHFASLARFWQRFYSEVRDEFDHLQGDILAGFRQAEEQGTLELLTSAATHAYSPLIGTDESLRAQFRVAAETHRRHFGRQPAGVWLPECGYRPAGSWSFPVQPAGAEATPAPTVRCGVEQILRESGLQFFLVDTHTVESATADVTGRKKVAFMEAGETGRARDYHPWLVAGESAELAVFSRDPVTAVQVWSAQGGYPGDFDYLDFYKKRWPGGHRLWRVTSAGTPMEAKNPYYPEAAAGRVREHARHFVQLVRDTLSVSSAAAPVLSAPFDAELFGHWWFEGIAFLEAVAREAAGSDVTLVTASEYLRMHAPTAALHLPEGSWGAGGGNDVWLNADTAWTYAEMYRAELLLRQIVNGGGWQGDPLAERILRQMCREVLLLESSDWQTLITTGGARDYAERRFRGHVAGFNTLQGMWEHLQANGDLDSEQMDALAALETSDCLFPDLHPAFWQSQACGAHPQAADEREA